MDKIKQSTTNITLNTLNVYKTIIPNDDSIAKNIGGAIYYFIGKQGSGKSTVVKALIKYLAPMIAEGVAISATEKRNGFYSRIFNPQYVYSEYSPTIINKINKRQDSIMESSKYKDTDTYFLLILDDLSFDKKIWNSKEINELIRNSRHSRIIIFIIAQFDRDMPSCIRENVNGIFMFTNQSPNSIEKVCRDFIRQTDYKTIQAILNGIEKEYTSLFVDVNSNSKKLEQFLFLFRPTLEFVQNTKFGAEYLYTLNNA